MDELRSENRQKTENEFKPDTSDRPSPRSRTQHQPPKLAVSRQHMMIGVGILVLLLLIIAISSALKSPTEHEKSQSATGQPAEKSIELSGSSSSANNEPMQNENSVPENPSTPPTAIPSTNSSHEIGMPPVSSTPSQELAPANKTGNYDQRIELPGDISDTLNQQQSNINSAVQKVSPSNPSLSNPPLSKPSSSQQAPAQEKPLKQTTISPVEQKKAEQRKTEKVAPLKTEKQHQAANHQAITNTGADLLKVPENRFTLQLSSASRSDTLVAFAKKNSLSHYKVYQTKRNDKTWFILIYGSYNSAPDAKKAISSLPVDIQAKKPWVRKMQQVHQDLKK
ncbi:MAG: SPOR domain-containing protein [Enterobacteriaceae bacterium]|nr:SPOR domain-containing protein [Enterobacteriaceae bacterium]